MLLTSWTKPLVVSTHFLPCRKQPNTILDTWKQNIYYKWADRQDIRHDKMNYPDWTERFGPYGSFLATESRQWACTKEKTLRVGKITKCLRK